MLKYVFVLLMLVCFNSCDTTETTINYEDRLEGYYALDPIISFYKFSIITFLNNPVKKLTIIDTLTKNDTLLLYVGEYNRSDLKACPAKGYELHFTIETASGDKEYYPLSDDTGWILHGDGHTPYIKFLPFVFAPPQSGNNMIEINNNGDAIIATYSSYWHGHVVKDTLIYKKEEK